MEMPNVKNVVEDQQNGVRYEIMAYRQLTREECILNVRMYLSQKKRRKPKRGDLITIVSVIGFND